jgi:hypothetical protein
MCNRRQITHKLLLDRPQFLFCSTLIHRGAGQYGLVQSRNTQGEDRTYHSSEDSESVNVGVGRRLRLRELPSSTEATASLSARRFKLPLWEDEEAMAVGGGDAETFSWPLFRRELSYERSFSSCSRKMLNKKSPRRTRWIALGIGLLAESSPFLPSSRKNLPSSPSLGSFAMVSQLPKPYMNAPTSNIESSCGPHRPDQLSVGLMFSRGIVHL